MIHLFSSSFPIVVKHSSFYLGAMNEADVLDTVESTFVIIFLMLSILSVKKFIKSLLLNYEGIFRSGDICLFVNIATVLNKNLGLFWLLSICLWIYSVLAAFIHCKKLSEENPFKMVDIVGRINIQYIYILIIQRSSKY